MTETVSIPPLVSGVTIYKTWKQSTVDKLKELELGELFRFPDPSKRSRFTGSNQCTQNGRDWHPSTARATAKKTWGATEGSVDPGIRVI